MVNLITRRAALESRMILYSFPRLQRPCHFTLALTVSCTPACSVWQSARASETPAHVRQFPWNNAVIPSGIDWDRERKGGRGVERENKYAPAHTVDSIGKNATVCVFKLRKNLSSFTAGHQRGFVIWDGLHALLRSELRPPPPCSPGAVCSPLW